jgi:hypothetical protein
VSLELTADARAELVDALATRLIVDSFEGSTTGMKLSRDSDRASLFYQTGRWTANHDDRKLFYLGFNPKGAWRKAAQSIIDALRNNYGDYSTSDAVWALRTFIERVDEAHTHRR